MNHPEWCLVCRGLFTPSPPMCSLHRDAPNLLAALEAVSDFAAEHPWTGLGDAKGYGDGKLLSNVRAAIANAKEVLHE